MYQNFWVYQNFNVSKCIKIVNFFKYPPKCTYVIYKCVQVYLNWFHSFKLCLSVLKCITNNSILQDVSKWITCIKILQMYQIYPPNILYHIFISKIYLIFFYSYFNIIFSYFLNKIFFAPNCCVIIVTYNNLYFILLY